MDKARKIIKKIGQELLVDPEFAAITIQPLKMQGIDSLGDSGLILRMKFTTVPGEQFMLKRRALMMINKAFHVNDIKPAFPTVQVAGDRVSDVAAAAQQALAKHNEAVVAAAASEGRADLVPARSSSVPAATSRGEEGSRLAAAQL